MVLPGTRVAPIPPANQFCPPPLTPADPAVTRQLLAPACAPGCGPNGAPPSALEHRGWQAIFLTGFLRHLLIHHFSEGSGVEEEMLRDLRWDADPARTDIAIESITKWDPRLVGKRPAIVIKRNRLQNERMGIGEHAGIDDVGNRAYSTRWNGSHTLFCLQGTGAAAEILAGEVQRQVTQFAPLLIEDFKLDRMFVQSIEELGIVEEASQQFVVPVVVAWSYQETWILRQEARPLQGVKTQFVVKAIYDAPTSDCLV